MQELRLSGGFPMSDLTQDDISNCSEFSVRIVVDHVVVKKLSFKLSMEEGEMEEVLNNITIIQNAGKMVVKKDNSTFTTSFIFLSNVHLLKYSVPLLELEEDEIVLNCSDSYDSGNFSLFATLATTQNLTLVEGFYLGYNHTHSPRFTPTLPWNVSHEDVEEEMNELLKWSCEYPTPSPSLQILYNNSFENGNFSDIDNSTAFCGKFSRRSPQIVWEDLAGLKKENYVRRTTTDSSG